MNDFNDAGKQKKVNGENKKKGYLFIIYIFFFLFMSLLIYQGYFIFVKSDSFINNPYNPRIVSLDREVIRGKIFGSNGEVLADTKEGPGGAKIREYPYGNLFCHTIGYMNRGRSGIELSANSLLTSSHQFAPEQIKKLARGEKLIGDNVITTLDPALQKEAYNQIITQKGAIIVMNPSTGAILAEASKPTFDPNTVKVNWNNISNDPNSSLLNRCIQGLYPPGSTFKVLTALSYLRDGGKMEDTFHCSGSYKAGNYVVHCAYNEAHGTQNLTQAFANSCNVTFSQIGLLLSKGRLRDTCEDFYFNKNINTDRNNIRKSKITLKDKESKAQIMSTSFGQGQTLVTPFEMCLVASTVCNNGIMMRPYVVDRVENTNGDVVKSTKQKELKRVMSENEAQKLESMMRAVVTKGTAKYYFRGNKNYTAYGKTGTAEWNDKKHTHSWFIGYAKNGEKQIAIAVILENTDKVAAVSAEKVFSYYFSR